VPSAIPEPKAGLGQCDARPPDQDCVHFVDAGGLCVGSDGKFFYNLIYNLVGKLVDRYLTLGSSNLHSGFHQKADALFAQHLLGGPVHIRFGLIADVLDDLSVHESLSTRGKRLTFTNIIPFSWKKNKYPLIIK
jgi:hypothetical protein